MLTARVANRGQEHQVTARIAQPVTLQRAVPVLFQVEGLLRGQGRRAVDGVCGSK